MRSLLLKTALAVALAARAFAQSEPASEPSVIAVGRVWPAVVNINTERIIKRTYQDPYDQLFNQFFGRQYVPQRQWQQKVQSLGSGFICDPSGYIVTNEHVVERAADLKIRVTTSDGKTYDGKYVSGDPTRDVAFIKITGDKPFAFISLDDLSPNLLGQSVLAVGNPLGYGLSVSRGILSALNRTITLDENEYKDLLQTDAAINPGNSGGPLIDLGGKLVGVNSVKMAYTPQGVPTQGLGFAIPGNIVGDEVRGFLHALKNPAAARKVAEAQSAAHRLFGLQLQEMSDQLASAFGYDGSKGVLIADVENAGPAAQAGMQRGMIILKIGRYQVGSVGEAEKLLGQAESGTPADFMVGTIRRMRGRMVQQQQTVSVTAR